jgi:hypothetical protein
MRTEWAAVLIKRRAPRKSLLYQVGPVRDGRRVAFCTSSPRNHFTASGASRGCEFGWVRASCACQPRQGSQSGVTNVSLSGVVTPPASSARRTAGELGGPAGSATGRSGMWRRLPATRRRSTRPHDRPPVRLPEADRFDSGVSLPSGPGRAMLDAPRVGRSRTTGPREVPQRGAEAWNAGSAPGLLRSPCNPPTTGSRM